MTTVLAILVGLGFVWSLVLFFAAVFMRERDQEAGFGWALAGAGAFLITFSDHLPGHILGLRHLLEVLPDVSRDGTQFHSPVAILVALAVTYLIRFVIFYQLFIDLADFDIDGDGEPDDVNDLVAPFLSYVGFSICLVTAISGVYGIAITGTFLLELLVLPFYYLTHLLKYFSPYVEVLYETVRSAVVIVWQRVIDGVHFLIIGIGRAELAKRGADTANIDKRARDRRDSSEARVDAARERRRQALAGLAKKRRSDEQRHATGQPRRGASDDSQRPRDPNVR